MTKKTKRSVQWVKGKKIKHAGIHLIAEFWGARIINNSKKIEQILIEAAKKANNAPLKVVVHRFLPQGITGVVLLAESHIALHSWPEFDYLAIDIFTCGKKSMPRNALKYLKKVYQPKRFKIREIKRAIL